MKLKSLKLTNFQGVENFTLDANLKDCEIRGTNAVGKTTIFSGFCFLLYGLDSTGKTFLPKPINGSGEPKHGISSEVEAIFLLDNDNEITLKKEFKELWTKKHNAPKKVFTGHTVKHFWDSVPISEKEYKKRLSEIAPEQVFKLLTSTRYFSEGLHWQDRRQILLDICGDISDEDIIKSNPALSRILEILDGKTLEEQKKIITSRKTKLNKELNELPVRIDEVSKGQPDITGLDLPAIEKELSELSKALIGKNEEVARIESGGEIAEKVKKQREIEGRLLEIENRINKAKNKAESEKEKKLLKAKTAQRKKISDLETAKEAEESARGKTEWTIKNREVINKLAEQEMAKLRVDWNAVNESVFDELSTICPTCGQNYPAEKAQEIKETFHTKKAGTLLAINHNGKIIKAGVEERNEQNKLDQADISLYEKKIGELTEQIDKIKSQAPEQETEEKPAEKDKEQEALALDLTEIKLNINGLRANSHEAIEKVKAEIDILHDNRITAETKILTLESHEKGEKRIKELAGQQRLCAKEFEELESQLFVMESFERAKASLLEKSVNEHFQLANFRLFTELVNGTLSPCCEVTYQGIDYNAGLNNSSRINVGIDICNTLSKHFGLNLVIFVDNAESVCQIIPSESQVIRLVVDEKYKELTVKIDK